MRIVIWIAAIAALVLGGVMLLAAPGAGFGFWEFGTSFSIFRTLAMPTMGAGALALIGAIAAFFTRRAGLGVLALITALVAGAGAYIPVKMRALAAANPVIHDITTDFENPPQILAAADLPRSNPPTYIGDEMVGDTGKTVAASQMEAFPDLTPIILKANMETATVRVRSAIDAMKMDVLAEGPVSEQSGSGWRVEAVYISTWFGFKDDFVVRLTSLGDGETRIDVRSKSRVGRSDLGANAVRVRTFSAKLADAG